MIRIAFGGVGRSGVATVALVVATLLGARPGFAQAQTLVPDELAVIPDTQPTTPAPPSLVLPAPPERAARPAIFWPMAGALTALVPLAAGGMLVAQDDRPDRQRIGTYVLLSGFAAAPWVAQAGAGRWRRALAYGLGSLVASTGAAIAMNTQDAYNQNIINRDRLPFGLSLTTAFFVAAAGVIDSLVMSTTLEDNGPPSGGRGDAR